VPIFTPETFDDLNRRESAFVERYVPAGPPPTPLLVLNVAANGSRLWFGIAALLALRAALRRAAIEGVVAALLAAGVTQVVNRLVGRPRPSADHRARRALPHQPVTPAFPRRTRPWPRPSPPLSRAANPGWVPSSPRSP